ncbi:MAG: polysaccharide deacetylase family protein, partial [Methanomassiliicoccales archaeon]|nr:polysaccharide deacetylase family protein [Methanomassiliicoccales archaeon]
MRRTGAVKEGEPFSQIVLSQGQYDYNVAIPRILKFLDAEELKGAFYVPGMLAEEHPDLVKDIAKRGNEVGHHGYAHLNPFRLNEEGERMEMEKGLKALEAVLGV